MKRIQHLLLTACAYTVVLLAVLYVFAELTDVKSGISFARFALVFAFGVTIALASSLLNAQSISRHLGIVIHYSVLLLAFIVLFVVIGSISTGGKIFAAIVIFTFFYALVFLLSSLINRAVSSADKRLDKKHPKKSKPTPAPYRSIYGKNDNGRS